MITNKSVVIKEKLEIEKRKLVFSITYHKIDDTKVTLLINDKEYSGCGGMYIGSKQNPTINLCTKACMISINKKISNNQKIEIEKNGYVHKFDILDACLENTHLSEFDISFGNYKIAFISHHVLNIFNETSEEKIYERHVIKYFVNLSGKGWTIDNVVE